jgi:phage gpG-like protein
MDFDQFDEDIKRQAQELQEFMSNDLLDIIEVEGLNHFEESFDNEGFTDSSLVKWEKRKTKDKKGRDITRYRTNKVGKKGDLNRYGRKNEGRAILTGHNTGGNKLRNSLRASKVSGGVEFKTDKEYAQAHNEGEGDMPKRQFIGESKQLDKKIIKKVDKTLDKIFNNE